MDMDEVPGDRVVRVKLTIDTSELAAKLRRVADALEAPEPVRGGIHDFAAPEQRGESYI